MSQAKKIVVPTGFIPYDRVREGVINPYALLVHFELNPRVASSPKLGPLIDFCRDAVKRATTEEEKQDLRVDVIARDEGDGFSPTRYLVAFSVYGREHTISICARAIRLPVEDCEDVKMEVVGHRQDPSFRGVSPPEETIS